MIKKIINKIFNSFGLSIKRTNKIYSYHNDILEKEFWDIYSICKPYTMTSVERMYSLYLSVIHVIENKVEGCFVECGVWRGGSSMLIASVLANRNIHDRKIYMYDTYEGMNEPTEKDQDFRGGDAKQMLIDNVKNKEESIWCLADIKDVQSNMKQTPYDIQSISFVKGPVEDTLPRQVPIEDVALLRLDTDWYDSTKHELIHLYPKLSKNGILIIDDYGHWAGCRKAVDEYFLEIGIKPLLQRIDYTGRLFFKYT